MVVKVKQGIIVYIINNILKNGVSSSCHVEAFLLRAIYIYVTLQNLLQATLTSKLEDFFSV